MSADPDDWEASQRRALMEFERSRSQSVHVHPSHYAAPEGLEAGGLYPWQLNRTDAPLRRSPVSADAWPQNEVLRRGQVVTQRAVRNGQSHIVLCHGCGNRLQAPGLLLNRTDVSCGPLGILT
jgi:hypothetical protein